MTPKEKAEKLIEEFMNIKSKKLSDYSRIEYPTARECALICVNEISKVVPYKRRQPHLYDDETIEYWDEVKEEIEKL